jgi:hypothetical protein
MAAQFEGAQRRYVDLRAAGEGGAQGHGGVHGADRGAYVPHDQQAQPRADQDDGDQAQGARVGVRLVDELDGRVCAASAIVAYERMWRLSYALQSGGGDAGH